MALPKATETVRDRGIGGATAASLVYAVIGVCSGGTANAVKPFSDPVNLDSDRADGPGTQFAASMLTTAGGPILYVKGATSVAASNDATLTPSAAGPDIALSGTAVIDANIFVEITLGGDRGVGKFRYSLDNFSGATSSERTYSAEQLIPADGVFAIPTLGVTMTFADDTFVLAETYTGVANCAAMNATDVNAAMDALNASGYKYRVVILVTSNNTGDSAAHATLAAAVQAKLTAFATASKYKRAMIAANVNDEDPRSDFEDVVAARVLVAYGSQRMIAAKSFIGYATPTVPALVSFAARASGSLPSTDLKRVRSGPLPNVLSITKDEEKSPTLLDEIKVSTTRTFEGKDGFYITHGLLKSAEGSDFTTWDRGVLMDIACETAHQMTLDWIGMGVRTNTTAGQGGGVGTIDERDAERLESEVVQALEDALLNPQDAEGNPGFVAAISYRINRNINILTTETIEGTVQMVPKAKVGQVQTTLSYTISIPIAAEAA